MLICHAVFVGHIVGGHIVNTEEPDRLAVNADFVLTL